MALCRQGVNEIHHFVIGFGLVAMYQALLYLVAVWVVLNRPVDRWTFVIILVCAAGCRLVCLFSPPFLSTDIFRYVWDGRVQAAGINPYRYIPADPHLAFLRDLDIYPHINRRELRAHHLSPGSTNALPAHHPNRRVGALDESGYGGPGGAHHLGPGRSC